MNVEKASFRTHDLGEGMERLRLCVSLLQKQVNVSAQHIVCPKHQIVVDNFHQMVQNVSVQRVRLPLRFYLNQG